MVENNISLGTVYDFNKQAMAQFSPLDGMERAIQLNWIASDIIDYGHYMLLCKERSDYTIIKINTVYTEAISNELSEILANRGDIIAIDKVEDSEDPVYEIWMRDTVTGENVLYMLFECSDFIVEVN